MQLPKEIAMYFVLANPTLLIRSAFIFNRLSLFLSWLIFTSVSNFVTGPSTSSVLSLSLTKLGITLPTFGLCVTSTAKPMTGFNILKNFISFLTYAYTFRMKPCITDFTSQPSVTAWCFVACSTFVFSFKTFLFRHDT